MGSALLPQEIIRKKRDRLALNEAEIGAFVLRSDTELLLKSRRVVPGRLLEAGFAFDRPEWPQAADDLVRRLRDRAVR